MKKKPKILLILPPSFLYPMGSAYVAATLAKAGYNYDIYGFFYDNRAWFKRNTGEIKNSLAAKDKAVRNISSLLAMDYLFDVIAKEQYEFILVGGLVGFFRWFYQILPQIKGYDPTCKIIMGGGITKDLSENIILDKLNVDYILRGEAETNLIQLLDLLTAHKTNISNMAKIPGLCWKDSSSAIRKNATVRLDLKNESVLPAWESLNIKEYIELSDTLFHFNKTFFPILAGRGCPNICAFCSPSVGRFTPCPVEDVISEMKYWVEKYEFDFFFIYSEVAFNDEAYTQTFCKKYIQEIGKPWVGQLRTDVKFSVDTYRLMKEAGCMFICMGFESANDRILKVMKKRTTFSDHMRNLEQATEAGLNVFGNFMFGHETETAEEIRETFEFLNKHDLIHGPSNGLATIITYPGTGYYRNAEKKGLVDDPFKFLLSYSLKAGISTVDIQEKNDSTRLNLSALSNKDFYNVVCTENIKHRHLYWKRHTAIEVKQTFELGSNAGFIFSGKCLSCGNLVQFDNEDFQNPLNITTLCNRCYHTVIIDVYQLPDITFYVEELLKRIANSQKIVIYGEWIMDLFFCGALPIPHEKLLAWVNPNNPECSNYNYFYHIPQLSLEELKEHEYDTILVLNSRTFSTPQVIEDHGLNSQCQIIYLLPDILNIKIVKAFTKKNIAIIGKSDIVKKTTQQIKDKNCAGTISHLNNMEEFYKEKRIYDFVVYDKNESGITRHGFAQNSQYQVSQILYTDHLLDGGFFTNS